MMSEMAQKPRSQPRRHHYVPRFYLARFADQKDRISVYDRTTGRVFASNAKNLAVETDFYQLAEEYGLPSTYLEETLAALEGDAANALREVDTLGTIPRGHRSVLAPFLGIQLLRTAQTRDVIRDMTEWSGGILAQIEIGNRLRAGQFETEAERQLAEQSIQAFAEGRIQIRPSEQSLVGLSLSRLEDIIRYLSEGWNWLVVMTTGAFLTSDHPVTLLGEPEHYSPATNVGVANALEIWLPITPRRALVLSRDHSLSSPLVGIPNDHLRAINHRIAAESRRWIYFRHGTSPLKGIQIPVEGPRWEARTAGWRDRGDGSIGELMITGVARPRVPRERLLSGRFLRPFPS